LLIGLRELLEWAELRFMTRAAGHGIMVSKSWGDSAADNLMLKEVS